MEHQIQTVFLMGDCRLYHRLAKPVCERMNVGFMVFEEGYLRSVTIILERGGLSELSSLDFSPIGLASASSQRLNAEITMPPSMGQLVKYAAFYYWAAWFQRQRFVDYQHHRAFYPVVEGAK